MFDFLDKLRGKPEPVRRRIAVISAAVVTGVIAVIWLSVAGIRFREVEVIPENTFSVFESFQGSFTESIESLKALGND